MQNIRTYLWPGSPEEALQLLQEQPGRGALLAGGTWLAEQRDPDLDFVVDISRLGLDQVESDAQELRVGATTTLQSLVAHTAISSVADGVFLDALRRTRTDPWRRQATLAGQLLRSPDPGDYLRPVLLALDGELLVLAPGDLAPRTIALAQASDPDVETALGPAICLRVRIPRAGGWRFALEAVSKNALDAPIACVVVGIRHDGGAIAEARVATSGLAERSGRCTAVERALVGRGDDQETFSRAQETLVSEVRARDDHRASRTYREHLARTLLARGLRRALGDTAKGGNDAPPA